MEHATLIAVFVAIGAIALVIQTLILLGFILAGWKAYQQVRNISRKLQVDLNEVISAIQAIMEIVSHSKESVKTITANAAEISSLLRERAASIDAAVGEIAERTRAQTERLDLLVTTLFDKVETTAGVVERTVIGPIQEITALVKGIQSGLDFFFSRRRPPSVNEATQDEEMFI